MMIAAPLGSLIASVLGLQYSMLLMAIPMTLAGLVALLIREPQISSDQPGESRRYLDTLKSGVRFVVKHKTARILIQDSIPIGVLTFFIIWLYQPLLTSLDVDVGYFGLVFALMAASQILVLLIYPQLEKLLGSKQCYLLLVSLFCGVGFITLGLLSLTAAVIPTIVLIAGFGMTRLDIFKNYLQKHIASSERATVLSTVSMLRRFGAAILNPFVGIMVDWSLRWSFVIIGGGLIVLTLSSQVREEHLID